MLAGKNPVIGSIIIGSSWDFCLGFLDDLCARLSPKTKLLGEFLIAGLVVWGKFIFTSVQLLEPGSISFPEWFGFGLSCLWIVGMANAIN